MSRVELLRIQREKVLQKITTDTTNRAKWLVALMDIDYEIKDLKERERKERYGTYN